MENVCWGEGTGITIGEFGVSGKAMEFSTYVCERGGIFISFSSIFSKK